MLFRINLIFFLLNFIKIHLKRLIIPFLQGSLHSDTVLPLFEEGERTIADERGLLTSFGAHRRNVEHVVDSHTYDSDDKVSGFFLIKF